MENKRIGVKGEDMTIDIKLQPGAKMPERHGECFDLATSEDVTIKKGEYALIPLGVSIKLPEGYYAELYPRSSTAGRWGVMMANSIGIIEHDYCGDGDVWGFPAFAIRDTSIPAGTRIAQFRLVSQMVGPIHFRQVETLGAPDRGGYGSTGL